MVVGGECLHIVDGNIDSGSGCCIDITYITYLELMHTKCVCVRVCIRIDIRFPIYILGLRRATTRIKSMQYWRVSLAAEIVGTPWKDSQFNGRL